MCENELNKQNLNFKNILESMRLSPIKFLVNDARIVEYSNIAFRSIEPLCLTTSIGQYRLTI